jgi:DNA-binding response OmpR family regulator
MPIALICSPSPLETELSETAICREDITRHVARNADDAVKKALELHPHIVVVDRDMPGADRIVGTVRRDPQTRRSSIVVVARGDLDPVEVDLLEAGANALLRLPVSPDWDERLMRLIEVPVRREMRVPVRFEMEARSGDGVESQTATVLNISISGMLIDSAFPLRMGDDLDVSFQLPDSDAVIRGTGRVVRQAGRTQFGLEFYGLEGDGRDLIAAYITSGPQE